MNTRFPYLVQKAMAMDKQDEVAAEKKNENNRGKGRHYRPEADVVDQPAETEEIGNWNEKVTYFVNHWDFLETLRPSTGAL
jgi:hypothetical protein